MDNANPFSNLEVLPLRHLGVTARITEREMEDEPTPFESLPLCFESFQIAKGEAIGHKHSPFNMVEQSANLVCIMDDTPPMNKMPKYDQYDDDYVL